eukprot:CAMPEP_0113853166 /NCGR_PEP_ID=MMETSP0372-20130328/6132_1 /TAXON_ID=340204 /ORGANISM="Lankesteria abbotti" /LENGTH=128 /DNA_ID=CAMNT_0000825231 /DNA_START=380 /DNA_END=766 /DNA_ORIENTATION=+ /assembly_acc=CAM_ASM_000359
MAFTFFQAKKGLKVGDPKKDILNNNNNNPTKKQDKYGCPRVASCSLVGLLPEMNKQSMNDFGTCDTGKTTSGFSTVFAGTENLMKNSCSVAVCKNVKMCTCDPKEATNTSKSSWRQKKARSGEVGTSK